MSIRRVDPEADLPLPPLSAAPEDITELYAWCFGRPASETTSAFARSVLVTLNALVACDFQVPRVLFERRLAQPTAEGDTLHDVLARGTYTDALMLAERTRQATFAHLPPLLDPAIWTLPVHLHLVRPGVDTPFLERSDPDRLDDLGRFDPAAARMWQTDRARFVKRLERDFVAWLAARNMERLTTDFGPDGARSAIAWLKGHFVPHNAFYATCIERIGSPGLRFRLAGISDVLTPTRIGFTRSDWLTVIEPAPSALNLVVTAASTGLRDEEEFAFFPQGIFPGPSWRVDLQRRAQGLASLPADALGYLRGPGRAFGRESGVALTHEFGHLCQLHHLGCARLHREHAGQDDFDYPAIGVASDTLWRRLRHSTATIQPEASQFVHTLHGRSMYMNFMSVMPAVEDALFFTRAQAARARQFVRIHYGALIERGTPWPGVERFVGSRDQTTEDLMNARFDAAMHPTRREA